MGNKTINTVKITPIDSNLFKPGQKTTFFEKIKNSLGFKHRKNRVVTVGLISGFLILTGIISFNFLFNATNNTAKASKLESELLDFSFGDSGQVPLIEAENKIFTNPKILENQNSLFGIATAVDKTNTSLKSLAVFSLNPDGSLNTKFNQKGYNILEYKNQASAEAVNFVINGQSIFIVSKIDDCNLNPNLNTCGASNVLVTKMSIDGLVDNNYGENGLAKFNLSENTEISKLGEREDYPVSIVAFTGGKVAFLSSYQYQNQQNFATGFKIVYLDNKGNLDKTQAIDGIQKFNHKNYAILAKNGDYEKLEPTAMTLLDRNSVRVEFTKDANVYGEVILDAFGKIRKNNGQDINLITVDLKNFDVKTVKLKGRKLSSTKIIFYGGCNPDIFGKWQSLCLVKYLADGQIDNTFANDTKNILKLDYPNGNFLFESDTNNFLEDISTQQIILSIAIRTENDTRTNNQIIYIKSNGELNTNFADKGIWRSAINIKTSSILSDGKIIAFDNSKIYRLVKPLFIDPVITKINPNNSSTLGGLEVTIDGNNFVKNPENPKFLSIDNILNTTVNKSSILNYKSYTDSDNMTYIAATIQGSLAIKDKVFETKAGETDVLITKVDSQKNILWTVLAGGIGGDDKILNITIDDKQNLYILGDTSSDLSLFNNVANGIAGQPNLFVAKYTKNGDFSWLKRITGSLSPNYTNLIIGGESIYVGGNFNGNIKIDDNQINSRESQGFIASLDNSNGNIKWLQSINSTSQTQLQVIKNSSNGDLVVGGTTNGNLNIGFDEIPIIGSKDIFVLKFDSNGKVIMASILGGKSLDELDDMIVTKENEIIISGDFSANPISNIENNGGLFVLKLGLDGKKIWSVEGSGLLQQDNEGNILLYGVYQDGFKVAGIALKSQGEDDVFVAKINSNNGKLTWLDTWGGDSSDSINSLYIDPDDNLYIGGNFKNSANFNNILLTSVGDFDLYLLKINPAGEQLWVKQGGSKSLDSNLQFAGTLTGGQLNFVGIVGSYSSFDKLVSPGDQSANLILGSIYDQELSVYFGNKLASKLKIVDKNKLIARVPSHNDGIVDVKIIGYDGSEIILPGSFEYKTSINLNLDQGANNNGGISNI